MEKSEKTHSKVDLKAILKTHLESVTTGYPEESHSNLFLKQGQSLLLKGDKSGLDYFEVAESLDPTNADMLYEMALSIAEYAEEEYREKALLCANKKLKKMLKLKPDFFPAYHVLASNLYQLGKRTGQHHYFLEAKEKFSQLLSYTDVIEKDMLYDIRTEAALNFLEIGIKSEEICDFNQALELFELAKEMYPSHLYEFWLHFGHVCLELADLIDDSRFYHKASDCYSSSIKMNNQHYEQWFYLGASLKNLYASHHEEDYFTKASECFSAAAKIDKTQPDLWLEWADLLLQSGRRLKDTKRLSAAVEKAEVGLSISKKDSLITAVLIESLATLGVLSDNINYLHEAENKALDLFSTEDASPEICHAHGFCLFAFGKYFNDVDYYYQAIEKFQEGLSIDRTYHQLWYAIGHTYAVAANIENDPSMYQQAISFFKKALHHKNSTLYNYETGLSYLKLFEVDELKVTLQLALFYFEEAINKQSETVYLHPEWLFHYAVALDAYADQTENEIYYIKAIEILSHVLVTDPDHPNIHHKMALVYTHFAELTHETELYTKALFHYKIAAQSSEENDILTLDWALTIVNYSDHISDSHEREVMLLDAEYKMIHSAKLGNVHSYYHLACLYSIMSDLDKAMHFMKKAKEFDALPQIDEMFEDVWLENLRECGSFKEFLSSLDQKSHIED
jgi:tetratricopeptide (TPR) repeat protein